jgi:hypothetical protein
VQKIIRLVLFFVTLPAFMIAVFVLAGIKLAEAMPMAMFSLLNPNFTFDAQPPGMVEKAINDWCQYIG